MLFHLLSEEKLPQETLLQDRMHLTSAPYFSSLLYTLYEMHMNNQKHRYSNKPKLHSNMEILYAQLGSPSLFLVDGKMAISFK